MFDKDPKDYDDTGLVEAIAGLGAQLAAATSRLLELVAEANERDLPGSWEARSPAQWLSWLTGFSPRAAGEHAEVAQTISDFPRTKEALSSGAISFDQARAITRTERPEREADLVQLATDTTAGQLIRVVGAYRKANATADVTAANTAHQRRFLHYFYDHDSFVLRGRLAKDDGAIVARAIDSARDRLYRANDPEHYLSSEQLSADALVGVADAALASTKQASGADTHQVVLHVDVAALVTDDAEGRCEIAGAGAIATETARRLVCDAGLVTMLEKDGNPLSVGRKTRRIPYAIRRAMLARDKMCRFPGCTNSRYADGHHIQHWTQEGETSLENLMLLCRFHHRLVHEGGYQIETGDGEQVSFIRPNGSRVDPVPKRPRTCATDVVTGNRKAGLEPYREPCAPEGAAHSLDLSDVTWIYLFQHDERKRRELERRELPPPDD